MPEAITRQAEDIRASEAFEDYIGTAYLRSALEF